MNVHISVTPKEYRKLKRHAKNKVVHKDNAGDEMFFTVDATLFIRHDDTTVRVSISDDTYSQNIVRIERG